MLIFRGVTTGFKKPTKESSFFKLWSIAEISMYHKYPNKQMSGLQSKKHRGTFQAKQGFEFSTYQARKLLLKST